MMSIQWFILLWLFCQLRVILSEQVQVEIQESDVIVDDTRATTGTDTDNVDDSVQLPLEDNDIQVEQKQEIIVEDYLTTLSDEELIKICIDRGFEIAPNENGQALTREDYIEGARRCLSLEDEMNAILAANPDLAAELDAEIARMKAKKEQLERERDEILAQKTLLETQLRNAGVDVEAVMLNQTDSLKGLVQASNATDENEYIPQTVEEVLLESFRLLFERVNQDVQFVRKILSPVLKPLGEGLKLVWRYAKPVFGGYVKQVRDIVEKQLFKAENQPDDEAETVDEDERSSSST